MIAAQTGMAAKAVRVGQAMLASHMTDFARQLILPVKRPMGVWVEQELIIPDGRYKGQQFRMSRQPWTRHWFNAIDSGLYHEFVATGNTQTGKSLIGFVVPILYHLFEQKENVIAFVPDLEMVKDKWLEDILPAIEASRYRDLLPRTGRGARGGVGLSMQFVHGVTLRWMTGGGRDKSRSAYTSRAIVMTEVDGADDSSEHSDEGTKIAQVEGRAQSWPERERRIYKECTVSTEEKHTWWKWSQASTGSSIYLPCPHCQEYVVPEREHLVGWEGADDEIAARDGAALHCPSCGEAWTETERRNANHASVLAHRGQKVDRDGKPVGPAPRTGTFGLRWTSANNLLIPMEDVAKQEWAAKRAPNSDLEERRMRQFYWTKPIVAEIDTINLTYETVMRRRAQGLTKGVVPADSDTVGLGVDINKRLLHWTAVSLRTDGSWHVFDYGRIEIAADDMPFDRALMIAMRELHEAVESFPYQRAMVDVRYQTDSAHSVLKSLGDPRWMAHYGLGDNHYVVRGRKFLQPTGKTKLIRQIGEGWYIKRREKNKRQTVVFGDAPAGKLAVQSGFKRDSADRSGLWTLFESSDPKEHLSFGKHIVAEESQTKFVPLKGYVTEWKTISKSNHWLDASSYARNAVLVARAAPKIVTLQGDRPGVRW